MQCSCVSSTDAHALPILEHICTHITHNPAYHPICGVSYILNGFNLTRMLIWCKPKSSGPGPRTQPHWHNHILATTTHTYTHTHSHRKHTHVHSHIHTHTHTHRKHTHVHSHMHHTHTHTHTRMHTNTSSSTHINTQVENIIRNALRLMFTDFIQFNQFHY